MVREINVIILILTIHKQFCCESEGDLDNLQKFWEHESENLYKQVHSLHEEEIENSVKLAVKGGRETIPGEVPYQVSLKKPMYVGGVKMYKSFCGGNIISKERVLTAAHCFLTNRKRIIRKLSQVQAVAGDAVNYDKHPLQDGSKSGQWRRLVNITSPRYYRYPLNDIALLHITPDWQFDAYVNSIPFASVLLDYKSPCTATGYGDQKHKRAPARLHIANLSLISRMCCVNKYMKNMRDFVCTIKTPSDITEGDSGSGLVCYGTGDPQEVDSRGILVGIQSKVNKHFPSLHTRVSRFYGWIQNNAAGRNGFSNELYAVMFTIYYINRI